MKRKIIITYDDAELKDFEVMTYALNVVVEGKISTDTKEVNHYSWLTGFTGKVQVYTRNKIKDNSADSLVVRKLK